ncbi:MAG: DnaJ domain-containing protein, partial [Pseudomonadota bacterium]
MADNPYSVLGVSRKASDDDIRKAFRKLAKELHPDLNRDNPDAAERFKKVGQAYDILGDPTKRAQFDRGEIGADGEQRRAYPGTGGAGGRPFGG